MKLLLVGCNHRRAPVEVRERLAFDSGQVLRALDVFGLHFPRTEAVLLSTCNRVEVYAAHESADEAPTETRLAEFLSEFHEVPLAEVADHLFSLTGPEAVQHLFRVAASLDSMVVGEPQIISQVKEAYRLAVERESAGPLTHALFQRALNVAKRVHTETALAQRRISIPSVAVADFAREVFDHFHDKTVLVLGAGEMGEETLRYLHAEGARDILVLNRSPEKAKSLAERWQGRWMPFEKLDDALVQSDLVIGTTGSREPIVTRARFETVMRRRRQKLIFLLDLAVPRDFDPALDRLDNVYLYSIDDLEEVCDRNRRERSREMQKADSIVQQETDALMTELNHHFTGPIIGQLRDQWEKVSDAELERLFRQLPGLAAEDRERIRQFRNRLVNKLLHPPLTALRDESRSGIPHVLLESLKKLFHIRD